MKKPYGISILEQFLSMRPAIAAAIYSRVGCRMTTADLLQETWLHLARLSADHPIDNARAYVHRVAANLAVDHVRGERRRGDLGRAASELLDDRADVLTPERVVVARDQLDAFRRAVAELPEQSRRIFFMNRFEEKSHRRIAQELGVSETTVNFHIRRVLQRLADLRKSLDDGN